MRRPRMLLALTLGLLATPLAAQQPTRVPQATPAQRLLPFLPEGTLMAISVPDLDSSIAEFADMPLAKMWREQEVQNFVGDARTLAKQQLDKLLAQAKEMHSKGAFPVDPEQLLALRVRGGTFAITKLNLQMGEHGPMPEVGMLLHLDFGASAEQWGKLVQMGMGMLAEKAGDEVVREEVKVGETQIVCLSPKDAPPGLEMGLNVAMVKSGILIGTLKDDVRAAIENMNKGSPVLAATEGYKEMARHVMADGAELEVYMRVQPFLDFGIQGLGIAAAAEPKLKWLDPEKIARAVDAVGLHSVKAVGATSTYKGGKAVSSSFTVAPAPDRKGVFAGSNKNLDLAFLKWVPKESVSFGAFTMEPMSLYDGLVAGLRAYDDKIAEKVLGQLDEVEKTIGFSLRDDLFGALGDTCINWSMPLSGLTASPPEMAFLVKVNDEGKIVKVLKSLTGLSHDMVTLEESEKRGVKSYQFHVNFDPSHGMGMNPFDIFNPTFAFKGGYLVAGFSPSDIRRVFQRMERTDDDPKTDIRGNKEFAVYADQIPPGIQSLSFTDWKASFEGYYQLLTGALAFIPTGEDLPIDMSLLPDSGTLTKHLFGSLSYTRAEGGGFSSTSISPLGPEVGVLVVGAVAAGAAVFVSMRKRF